MSSWEGTPFPGNLAWCKKAYSYLEKDEFDSLAISYTVIIILCTAWLELLAHAGLEAGVTGEPKRDEENSTTAHETATQMVTIQPPCAPTLDANEVSRWSTDTLQHSNFTKPLAVSIMGRRSWFCVAPAHPAVRGMRLLMGFFFYQAVAGCFGFRMAALNYHPRLEYGCERYIHIPGPNWPAIVFFNIIPFVCATSAFLRILVDLALLKLGTGLHYDWRAMRDKKGCAWLPFMPIVVISVVIGGIAWGVVEGVRALVRWLSGKKGAAAVGKMRRENMDMEEDEEEQGLLDGTEEGGEDEELQEYIQNDEARADMREDRAKADGA